MNIPTKRLILALVGMSTIVGVLLVGSVKDQQRIEKQNKLIHKQDEKIESLSSQIGELKKKIEDKDFIIDGLNQRIEKLQQENMELNDELNKVKKEKEELISRGESNRSFYVEMTSYTAFCPTGCTGKTATGVDVSNTIYYKGQRVVAVDPSVIKLGSLLKVETESETFYAYALDTGGAIKKFKIDLLVENREIAYQNGRQKAKVTIIKEG